MGIRDLQAYIETHCEQACKSIDLIQMARQFAFEARASNRRIGSRFRLVVDAEGCLHKLYGGYYLNWVCGGQWNTMLVSLMNLVETCRSVNIELVVYFNGALESQRTEDWCQQQAELYGNILDVTRLIHNKGTPPPKVWWVPPPMLATSLRLALRQLGVTVACSTDDHHQEVIAYCREHELNGVVAQDCDYVIFSPPHYFSANELKLSLRGPGALGTKEYVVDDIAKAIDLHPNRFCILATLLGTHLLPESDLRFFYCYIAQLSTPAQLMQFPRAELIKTIIGYVRSLVSVDDLDAIAGAVFRNCPGYLGDKVSRFKQSVQYYVNGTKDGFFNYRPKPQPTSPIKQPGSYPSKADTNQVSSSLCSSSTSSKSSVALEAHGSLQQILSSAEDPGGCGTDSVVSGYSASSMLLDAGPPIAQRLHRVSLSDGRSAGPTGTGQSATGLLDAAGVSDIETLPKAKIVTFKDVVAQGSVSFTEASIEFPETINSLNTSRPFVADRSCFISDALRASQLGGGVRGAEQGDVSPDMMHIVSERHQKGLMYPWVYQLLSQREIRLTTCLEDESNPDLPLASDLYRPLRQRVYAILFDLSEQIAQWQLAQETPGNRNLPKPSVVVKEWLVPGGTGGRARCDAVPAEPLDWAVPSLQRLWLGTTVEDKSYRLKTFLACMRCECAQNMMLNTAYVPQHLLLFCCVLRYILSFKKWQVLLKPQELDALLATAVSPLLQQTEDVQQMELPLVQMRGVHIATLVMRGVEHALFVNDAVGAPIAWGFACPWLFFDGKLFHMKLLKATNNLALIDVCDGNIEQVVFVEKMRTAILNGIQRSEGSFSYPVRPLMEQQVQPSLPAYPAGMNLHPPTPRGMCRGMGGGGMGRAALGISDARGGMLEIAGVVVGSWGANTVGCGGAQRAMGAPRSLSAHSMPPPPRVMSVGPRRGVGRGGGLPPIREKPGANASRVTTGSGGKLTVEQWQVLNSSRGRGMTVELKTSTQPSTTTEVHNMHPSAVPAVTASANKTANGLSDEHVESSYPSVADHGDTATPAVEGFA